MAKPALIATKVRVIAHRGANKQPAGGDVGFSDGRFFGFHLNIEGQYTFTVYGQSMTKHGLKLPKREAALIDALNSGENVDSSPIVVRTGL